MMYVCLFEYQYSNIVFAELYEGSLKRWSCLKFSSSSASFMFETFQTVVVYPIQNFVFVLILHYTHLFYLCHVLSLDSSQFSLTSF